jgi:hypothetical protein
MKTIKENTVLLKEKLHLQYLPVGFFLTDEIPDDAISFKKGGSGCVAPLIFSAAKGKTVAIGRDSTGYPCSSFYLGYSEWIFPGIENFLSHGPFPGRDCEKFIKTPDIAREYILSFKAETKPKDTYLFKPLDRFKDEEVPEVVIFFGNADQMSALVFLLHYNNPLASDRVITNLASACMSFVTIPLRFARNGEKKAFWGLHDISIRNSFPADLTSMAMPFEVFNEMCSILDESFLYTEKWNKLSERIEKQ